MANKIIALDKQVSISAETGEKMNMYSFGQIIGDLKQNLNNGTLLVNEDEIVDINKVAIMVNPSDAIVDTTKFVTQTVSAANRTQKMKKIISIGILGAGGYFLYKGKKAIGITMIVAGLYMVKQNFKK